MVRYHVRINYELRTILTTMAQEFGVTFNATEIERIWIYDAAPERRPDAMMVYTFYDTPNLRVIGEVQGDWETAICLCVDGQGKYQQQFNDLIHSGRV